MLEEGIYYMASVDVGYGESSKKSTPYVWITGEVTHGSVQGEWKELPIPREKTIYLYTSDKAFPISEKQLIKIGFNFDMDNPAITTESGGIEVECVHDEYEGKVRERWSLAGGKFQHTELSADSRSAMSTRFANTRRNKPPAPVAAPSTQGAAADDPAPRTAPPP